MFLCIGSLTVAVQGELNFLHEKIPIVLHISNRMRHRFLFFVKSNINKVFILQRSTVQCKPMH